MSEDEKPLPPIGSPASNDLVRARLAVHGDDGLRCRDVEHVLRPDPEVGDALSFGELTGFFEKLGYKVEALEGDEAGAWLQAGSYFEVSSDDFDGITMWFVNVAEKAGWIYDGWSCDVLAGLAGAGATDKEGLGT